ncbi:hypothetical protein BDV93DRAFT_508623 [Ceratobasidium sp. AG-I]|nr:hypothetical protein BDV93DRAFT_508623 [Ceratobasidium sp. AG-I]
MAGVLETALDAGFILPMNRAFLLPPKGSHARPAAPPIALTFLLWFTYFTKFKHQVQLWQDATPFAQRYRLTTKSIGSKNLRHGGNDPIAPRCGTSCVARISTLLNLNVTGTGSSPRNAKINAIVQLEDAEPAILVSSMLLVSNEVMVLKNCLDHWIEQIASKTLVLKFTVELISFGGVANPEEGRPPICTRSNSTVPSSVQKRLGSYHHTFAACLTASI